MSYSFGCVLRKQGFSLSGLVAHHHCCRKNRKPDAYGNHDRVNYRIHPTASFSCVLQIDSKNRDGEYGADNNPPSNGSHDRYASLEISSSPASARIVGLFFLPFTHLSQDRALLGGSLQQSLATLFLVSLRPPSPQRQTDRVVFSLGVGAIRFLDSR